MFFQRNEAPQDPKDKESRCHEPPEWRPANISITGPAPRTVIMEDKATDPIDTIDPPTTVPTNVPSSPAPTEGAIIDLDLEDVDDDEDASNLVIDETPMTLNASPVYTSTPLVANTHQPSIPLPHPNSPSNPSPPNPPTPLVPATTTPMSPCVAGPSTLSSRAEVTSTEEDEQTATATEFDGELREMFERFFSDDTPAPSPTHIDLTSAVSEDLTTTLNVILKQMDLKKAFLTKVGTFRLTPWSPGI